MDGPTHYAEAEKSFAKAQEAGREKDGASAVLHMQAAQYHATMALAAATAATVEEHWKWIPWEGHLYPDPGEAQDL